MPYQELEHYLGRGDEKFFWVLSIKNAGGFFVGGFLGHRLGTVLLLPGGLVLGLALLGAIIGIVVTMQARGILVLRRLLIVLAFYVRRAVRPTSVDASQLYEVHDEREQPIRVQTLEGSTLLAPRHTPPGGLE